MAVEVKDPKTLVTIRSLGDGTYMALKNTSVLARGRRATAD